ncbi:SRPBCC family protein [Rathayibacter sp. ZW T2_19]|uniref:SRPBCC family protein n=1 Tax=Rathayibacter rubneri TaxID=2950106 RepID=A0A9X2IUL5_9MICO|nr:SRPBCC family protein [Rathayibacter rubneri]MCM6762734.1 SRPBCC family protein [Rathayibacter rubneri]
MTGFDPRLDLEISRVLRAPRSSVWAAWTTPELFARWWIPAPARCRVDAMDVRPGGALETSMSNGDGFVPHLSGCYLAVDPEERLVFTTALVVGWRPAAAPFITAVVTLEDHSDGTLYRAHVMHKDAATRDEHERLGFADGWGTVAAQLAAVVEG